MNTGNFPEKARQRRLGALKRLKGKGIAFEHEHDTLVKRIGNDNNHYGHKSKKDHSANAKLSRNGNNGN